MDFPTGHVGELSDYLGHQVGPIVYWSQLESNRSAAVFN